MLRLPPISTLFPYTTLFRSFLEPIAIHKAELLNPAPDVCLRDIQVALGVNRQRMAMCEVAQLMPGTTKTRQDLSAGMFQDVDLLVAAVHHVHEFLLAIARKGNPPDSASRIGHRGRPRLDPDIPFEAAHLVEHLDPIALAVAHVQESGVAHGDAMHDL